MNENETYIYGRNSIIEALESDKQIEKIWIMFGAQGDIIQKIIIKAKNKDIPCSFTARDKFFQLKKRTLTRAARAQGVIALVSPIKTFFLNDYLKEMKDLSQNPIFVILDGITDPHNLGAIARSAECAGAEGIIVSSKESAPITPTAIKISSGALEHISVIRVGSLLNAINLLKENGFTIIGTSLDTENSYADNIYDKPVAIIIGREGTGMQPIIAKNCDYLAKIPLFGKCQSLNSSVAAGIVLFEAMRQRNSK